MKRAKLPGNYYRDLAVSSPRGLNLIQKSKIKLFYDMFTFLSLYYGSAIAARKAIGVKAASVKQKMIEGYLNTSDAKKILDGYNLIKKELK